MKKFDYIIIFSLLLGALLLVFIQYSHSSDIVAEIYLDDSLYKTVKLDGNFWEERIDTPYGYNVISVNEKGVAVVEADCRNQTCVHTMRQNMNGGIIACLPHRLLIKIEGDNGGVDAVVR